MENDELKNKNRQLESSASSGGAGTGMMKNALIGFMKNKGRLKIHQMLMLKVGQDFLNIDLKRL